MTLVSFVVVVDCYFPVHYCEAAIKHSVLYKVLMK